MTGKGFGWTAFTILRMFQTKNKDTVHRDKNCTLRSNLKCTCTYSVYLLTIVCREFTIFCNVGADFVTHQSQKNVTQNPNQNPHFPVWLIRV